MIHYFFYEMLVGNGEGICSTVTFNLNNDRRKSRPLLKISILSIYSNGSVSWKDQFEAFCDVWKKGRLWKCEKEVILKMSEKLFPFFNGNVLALIHIEMRDLIVGLRMQNINLKCGSHGYLKISKHSFSIFYTSIGGL